MYGGQLALWGICTYSWKNKIKSALVKSIYLIIWILDHVSISFSYFELHRAPKKMSEQRCLSFSCWVGSKVRSETEGERRYERDNRQLCWAMQRCRVRLRAVSEAEVCLLPRRDHGITENLIFMLHSCHFRLGRQSISGVLRDKQFLVKIVLPY